MNQPPPEIDSPELTDEDIAGAIPTGCAEDVAGHISKPCPTCGSSLPKERVSFRKLRRGPHFYSKVTLGCSEGHEWSHLFEMTWFLRKK